MKTPYRSRLLAFSIIAVILAFGLMEAGLRTAGFTYHAGPVYMQFGYPDPQALTRIFQPDPKLFWKLIPGSLYLPDRIRINSSGFRGHEFQLQKTPGTIRIVSIGDSCTFLGKKSYPARLEDKLRMAYPGKTVQVLNMAVPGYSSLQGLRILEKYSETLRPDIITVFFGWNDQWPCKGVTDKEQKVPGSLIASLGKILSHFRFYQAIHWLVDIIRPQKQNISRVPLHDFRQNLTEMVKLARKQNAKLLLITAPTAAKQGSELAPYLLAEGIIQDADHALYLHEKYHQAVRDIAADTGSHLVDAAGLFEENPRQDFFWKDNIHLSEPGLEWLANIIANKIQTQRLIR
jgi:lysophospholipase L1-like esterase